MSEAYDRGYQASVDYYSWVAGASPLNPYITQSEDHNEWLKGWIDANKVKALRTLKKE